MVSRGRLVCCAGLITGKNGHTSLSETGSGWSRVTVRRSRCQPTNQPTKKIHQPTHTPIQPTTHTYREAFVVLDPILGLHGGGGAAPSPAPPPAFLTATNQPTNPPTHPPTNQPTHPPTNQPTNHTPTHQPTNPPTNQPTRPPTNQPTHPPTNQPTHPPTNPPTHPASQTNKQTVKLEVSTLLT